MKLLSIGIIIFSIYAFLPSLAVAYTEPKDMDNNISNHDNILPIAYFSRYETNSNSNTK